MRITVTELRKKLTNYLNKARNEDIFITKNGKDIAVLTSTAPERIKVLRSLAGIIDAPPISKKELRKEINKKREEKYERGLKPSKLK